MPPSLRGNRRSSLRGGEAEAPELLPSLAPVAPLPPASFSAWRRSKVGALFLPGPASARQTTIPVVAGGLPARGHGLPGAAARWPPDAGLGLQTVAVGVGGELEYDLPLPPLAVSPASALRSSIFAASESLHLALHGIQSPRSKFRALFGDMTDRQIRTARLGTLQRWVN